MRKSFFKLIAKANKAILPSYTKKQLDLSKATKLQLAIIGWRAYVTMNALDEKKTTDW
ncbi:MULTISPECIES: SsrA-binding protein [Winogradskyella]|uniref:SsrA-binding protein n=1 Tax=Winogradskyella TaxID=286104 RepID=UPI001B04904B|nr:SsrA-binding protein [Winogradskyella sp.]MBO6880600.1 SsrA-binding protein [Winogradskyella sp.]